MNKTIDEYFETHTEPVELLSAPFTQLQTAMSGSL